MSNMSYCMYHNTKKDLNDCVNDLEIRDRNNGLNDNDELFNTKEFDAMVKMISLCKQFIEYAESIIGIYY